MTEVLPYKPLYFRPGSLRLAPGSKYSGLIGTMSVFSCLYFGLISQMELKFVTNSYFKQLFQNLRPKLQYSKYRIFVTSHFGTLLYLQYGRVCVHVCTRVSVCVWGGGGSLYMHLCASKY